ncbi:MAG: hypothetical protein ACXWIN_00725 [Burkholderiaceae bacterium]
MRHRKDAKADPAQSKRCAGTRADSKGAIANMHGDFNTREARMILQIHPPESFTFEETSS